MNTFFAIIAAIITFLGAVLPNRDFNLSLGGNRRRIILTSRKILLTLGIAGLIVSIVSIFISQHDKNLDEEIATNVGILKPSEAKSIVWNLGGHVFYFNSNDIDIKKIVFGNVAPFDGLDFRAKLEDNKIKVSTTIRDSSGNIICQLADNEWIVNRPQFAFDRNFNDTSLEVKDNLGDVVFQIEISGDNMFMNAKFVKPDGELIIAFPIKKATPTVPGFNGIANFESGHYKWASQYKFCHFEPMFKYSSALHPKERLPNIVDTFTGVKFDNLPYYPKDIKDSSKNYLIISPNF